jgi:hypothetical protein
MTIMSLIKLSAFFLLCVSLVFTGQAQLAITVSPVKITGQRVIVPLALTNHLPQSVESARAMCVLLNDQGKMVGQTAKWVIGGGGKGRPALTPNSGTTYNFVITSPQPLTSTNLTAKIVVTRVILEHHQITNANAVVTIDSSAK